MPISLPFVSTQDEYEDATTIPLNKQIGAIQFAVQTNNVYVQVGKLDFAGQPIWDDFEAPFFPGAGGYSSACYGIRFRSAVAGSPALVAATAYFADDPVPFSSPGPGAVAPSNTAVPYISPLWLGQNLPIVTGPGNIIKVPKIKSVITTFQMTLLTLSVAFAGSGTYIAKIQNSLNGGVTWNDLDAVSLPPGANSATAIASGVIFSDQLLRIFWLQLGSGASIYTVQYEGNKA